MEEGLDEHLNMYLSQKSLFISYSVFRTIATVLLVLMGWNQIVHKRIDYKTKIYINIDLVKFDIY